MTAPASPSGALTLVTAANQRYWRSLYQFLLSVERVGGAGLERVVAFDLGIEPAERQRMQVRFPQVQWRSHDLSAYPAHVRPEARTCAWKPVVMVAAMSEFGGRLLWLDSATLLRRAPTRVIDELERVGIYAMIGASPLFTHCHDETLRLLGCDPDFFDRPEHPAGVCAFDTDRPAVRDLLLRWKQHSLDPACITPQSPPLRAGIQHKWDQAILTVLLYQFEAREGVALCADEIDITSANPAPWLSTRNKLRPDAPVWADPIYRAFFAAQKTLDQTSVRVQQFISTRVDGLLRRLKERFEIRICKDGAAPLTVPCPASRYFADPFLVARGERRHLFFEDFDHAANRGRISALAIEGEGPGLEKGPPVPVLERRFHLSYPFLFEHEGELFMIPESHQNRTVDIYHCERFPDRFRLRRRVLWDIDAADSTLLVDQGMYWLFTSVRDAASRSGRSLAIFYADDLFEGDFHPHPVNAQRLYAGGANQSGRCAGPFVREGDSWLRPTQVNPDYYGQGLEWRRIVTLTKDAYVEEPCAAPAGRGVPHGVSSHHISTLDRLTAFDVRTRHP